MENIIMDSSALYNALDACKNSLNKEISEGLSEVFNSDSVLICDSRNKFQEKVKKILDTYVELTDKLDAYMVIASEISGYQGLYNELVDLATANVKLTNKNASLQAEYDELKKKQYYSKEVEYEYEDEYGETQIGKKTEKVENTEVTAAMKEISDEISGNKDKIKANDESIAIKKEELSKARSSIQTKIG